MKDEQLKLTSSRVGATTTTTTTTTPIRLLIGSCLPTWRRSSRGLNSLYYPTATSALVLVVEPTTDRPTTGWQLINLHPPSRRLGQLCNPILRALYVGPLAVFVFNLMCVANIVDDLQLVVVAVVGLTRTNPAKAREKSQTPPLALC